MMKLSGYKKKVASSINHRGVMVNELVSKNQLLVSSIIELEVMFLKPSTKTKTTFRF